jgi:hypothetical protein
MNLKLKDGLEEVTLYVPFENRNCVGKFIPEGLYPHLYRIAPELFDVITESTKKTKTDDTIINNTEPTGSSDAEGKSI